MRTLLHLLAFGVAFAAGCACAPPPGMDAAVPPMLDTPHPRCIERFVRDLPGPLRPGGLTDSIDGIDGLGVAGPILVARMVDDELMVSAGLLRYGAEIVRYDAVLYYDTSGAERLAWAEFAVNPQGGRDLVLAQVGAPSDRPQAAMVVDDRRTGTRAFQVRLGDRFPDNYYGACNPGLANMMFVGREEHVVLFRSSRCAGAIDEGSELVWYRAHVWDRTGLELTPIDGVPVEEPAYLVPYFPEVDSLDSNNDGELFYGAQRAGLDAGSSVGLRVVRRAPDMTLSMVSEPITDPDLDLPGATGLRRGYGFWGAATADGAYVAHVVAPVAPGGTGYSHFVRVERDGSIGWHYTTFALAARGVDGLDRMVAEYDGGIVALVSDASLDSDLSMFVVSRDGTLVHGPRGLPVAERVGYTFEVRDSWIAMDGDGAGGLFVGLMGDDAPVEGAATHLAADGSVLFGPVEPGFFRSGHETELFQVLADGEGGMWMVASGNTDGLIQHVDALGRPLYREHWANCATGSVLRSLWEHSIIDYSDGDAGAEGDAGVEDAGGVVIDGGALDADLDASDAL